MAKEIRRKINKPAEPKFSEEPAGAKLSETGRQIRIENLKFEDETCERSLNMKEFYECTFHNVRFTKDMKNCLFADAVFDHCDFSNISMNNTVFRRVRIRTCRMMGTELAGAVMQDTVMEGCQGSYLNLNGSKLKRVTLKDMILEQAGMSMVEHSDISIENCNFTKSEWIDTKMNGLDLSDSQVDGIMVDPENLRGLTVNEEQAVAFAELLGLNVRKLF
ncbi:MAG: pentapeptide repeat-containing protein [Solobacterium sp.]|nr:pentapeptide repeat-containing protein [Solobacterium sp.]